MPLSKESQKEHSASNVPNISSDPEGLMFDWNEFVCFAVHDVRSMALSEFDHLTFRELIFGAWQFFKDNPIGSAAKCRGAETEIYGTFGLHLNLFSVIKAFSNSGCSVLDRYLDRKDNLEIIPASSKWNMKFMREYATATIAAECLCQKISSNEKLAEPICSCTLQTFGFSAEDPKTTTGLNSQIYGNERFFEVQYDVNTGILRRISEILDHITPGERFYPW